MSQSPITIFNLDDERIAAYRNVRDADLRGRDGLFMAESELVIRRLLRTPERIHSLFLSPNKYERLQQAIAQVGASFPVYVADIELMSDVAGFHIHRGALAAGYHLKRDELTLDAALGHLRGQQRCVVMIAEGWTNVDNMGALFRNAAAFGADGVVLDPLCCDPLYRKAIRVSAGHALSVPYAVADDWPPALDRLREEWDLTVIAAEHTPGARSLREARDLNRAAIVFGSEGPGITPEALAKCHEVYAIPMAPGVPSLNVAVAAAIFLYELQCRVE